jgi:hypothetical protein
LKWAFSQKIVVWPRLLCFIFLLTMSYKIRKNRVIGHYLCKYVFITRWCLTEFILMSSEKIAGMRFLVYWIRDGSCGRRVGHRNKFRNPQGKTLGKGFLGTFFLKRRDLPYRARPLLNTTNTLTHNYLVIRHHLGRPFHHILRK